MTALVGEIFALPEGNPEAIVGAGVTIATSSNPASTIPDFSVMFDRDVTNDGLIINESVDKRGVLKDGTYFVHGVLGVNTSVSEVRSGINGSAQANFFNFRGNPNTGLGAMVAAAPVPAQVPEPATATLLGIGVSALGGALWRRSKKAC